jgi:uncharacterized protein YeaO (DUF488 family)
MTKKPDVRMRRTYDEPTRKDGTRVLVDRVWPRGLSKDAARIDDGSSRLRRPRSRARGTATTQSG